MEARDQGEKTRQEIARLKDILREVLDRLDRTEKRVGKIEDML